MKKGFTLSELLIALAILGVIATFTIPKVLNAQQDAKYNSITKETFAAVSEAYAAYRYNQAVPSTLTGEDLIPYLNYVKYETSGSLDYPTGGTNSCSDSSPCLRLHNGALLGFYDMSFGGTGSTNAIWFNIDPDGKSGGPTNGPDGFEFALYYSGRITSWKGLAPNTVSSDMTRQPSNLEPS